MMCLLCQHELTGAGKRFKSRFGKRAQLIFAITVGEHGKAVKVEPVITRLIKGLENSRFIRIATAPLEKIFSLFASITPEIFMQEIDHSPKVATLFDIDLKEISQVIKRRTGVSELTLLFNRGRFGVALSNDDAAKRIAKFTRDFLVGWFTKVVAKADDRVRVWRH